MINKENYPHYIVAIGASAGGLEALQDFLTNFPVELKNISIIIAQHLSPTHKSMLVQLLGKNSKLNVQEAKHLAIIEPSQVYIAPPDADITVSNEKIILTKPQNQLGPKPSVDLLFQSLANALHERVIGVILSGTGTDGAIGVRAIKKNGGFTLAQEPHTAKYNGMPIAAIDTGDIDSVLLPEKMGEEIKEFVLNPVQFKVIKYSDNEEYNSLDQIFKLLSSRTGTDFSNYKEATVKRRLEKRINELKLKSIKEYLVFIENNPSELDEMFNKILIGVTSFFRDSEAFLALELYIKKIINNSAKKHIRIWAPASSTGEEAYSIAIILARLLKDKINQYNIQIFATDIDDRAITIARKGLYTPEVIQNIPNDILNEYFLKNGNNYELVKSIRSMVLFSKHDVTNNPPFLKLDLICCRNLLIYFGANLQKQIIPLFHYSLNENGYLFLGKSETVGQFSDLFNTIDAKNKIFQHKKGYAIKTIQFSNFKAKLQHATKLDDNAKASKTKTSSSLEDIIKETIYTDFENPYVIINENFDIQSVHGDVRLFLSFTSGNVNVNLIKMVNAELQIELRAIITRAIKDFKNIKSPIKKFNLFGQIHYVRLCVKPLKSISFSDNLLMVIFEKLEIDEFILKENLITDKELIDNRVQELEKELIQTKEHLQTFIEELETSNEELQSLNEEMHSTNEELQSSNEELETSNEELQSTNEEVQIAYTELKLVNDELFKKEKLLTEKQAKLNALLDNNLQGFILVDESYLAITFNEKAKSIFNLFSFKPLQEGASLFDYFESQALEELIVDFKTAISGKSITKDFYINDLTQNKLCFSINFTPIINELGEVKSFSFGLIEITKAVKTLEQLTKAEKLLDAVFNATAVGVCITNENGVFVDVNNEYCKIYGYTKEELIGNNFTLVVPLEYKQALQNLHDEFIDGKEELAAEWQVQRKNGTIIDIYASAELLVQPDGKKYKVTSVRDITENKKYKNLLFETQESGKIGGIELDLITNEFSCTEEIATLFDLESTEILTFESLINYFKDEAKISIKNNFDEIQKNGNSFDLELELLTQKTKYKWVRITAKATKNGNHIVKAYATIQDITKEKQHELQILNNKEKYKAFVENSLNSFIITNINGDIIEANQSACNLFVCSNEKLLTKNVSDFFEIESPAFIEITNNQKTNGKAKAEINAVNAFGNYFMADYSSVVYKDLISHEDRIFIYLSDITNRVKNTNLLNEISIMGKIGGWEVDLVANKATWSDVTKLIHEVPLDYEPDLNTAILFYKEGFSRDTVSKCVEIAMTQGTPWDFELQLITAKGNEKWVRAKGEASFINGKCVKLFGVFQDVTYRKERDLRIEEQSNELNNILNTSLDIICIIDNENKFEIISNSAENILGYKPEELKGKPFLDFVFIDDVEQTKAIAAKVYEGRSVTNFKNRYVHKNGSLVPFSWAAKWDKNAEKMYCIARDITENQKFEKEILEINERFEYVTKATFDAIWDWDLQNDMIYWGAGFKTLFGYDNVNTFVKGKKNWVQRIHQDDLEKVELELTNFIESTENNLKFEYRYLRADGTYVFVIDKAICIRNEKGKVVRMIGAMQDLTEQKINEERLKLFQSVIENTNDGVIITKAEPFDEPGPEIIYANNAMSKISGYTQNELIGSSPRLMQGPDTSREELDKIRKAIENWQPVETEIINYRKNGEEYWLNFSIVPVANEKGWFTHWISIERDITARKKAEQEREQLLNELTNNNKELKQFSYITSHNMRSPLTNILAILDLFNYEKINDKETTELIDALKQSTNKLHETLNDLIKILIIKENTNQELENVNIEEVFIEVKDSINSLVTRSNAQINLNFSKANKLSYSKSYLESIFLNLLTNSIKYASKDRDLQITVSTQIENKKIKLTYTDNGLGFDMDKVKDKIFGLYQRFHTHTDSKGIGLYLVYSQIVALGGNIKVESEVNKGTTFTIHF
jgi:two-component system, chemotaxis family, CheB/CheR fusion protein